MLDIQKIRNEKKTVEQALLKRLKPDDFNLDKIIAFDDQRKELTEKINNLRAERNQASKTKPSPEIIGQMKGLGDQEKKLEEQLNKVEVDLNEQLAGLPNLPAEDVVAGGKENNKVIFSFQKKSEFKFKVKDHLELSQDFKLIDYQRAAKMSGSGFWIYTNQGALLEWALINYFIDFHKKNKYRFILFPYLLTEQSAYTSGHLPKFKDDLFWTQDKLCLNATSEMMLGNYHRDEVIKEEELPLKYFSFSACFRREAGSYRTEERGMIRGHQFNKVEMFQLTKPEQSWLAFEELRKNAEDLLKGLELHFQTSQLAAADASSAMAKTVDLEVWIPSMNLYKEVSSVSNALDYQARRGNIRFKNKQTGKNEFVHTLNASGLATSRLLPAILEQFQQADGSIKVPRALQKYLDFKEINNNVK